jgi:activator of HSP90 ATPase
MCKTIKQRARFKLEPGQVYHLLTDSQRHTKLTGQKAVIGNRVGSAFSTHGGRVSGILVDLVPGRRVVQAWRSKDFPVGAFSMASFELSPTNDGGTELVLTHRGVPKALIPSVEADWRTTYWDKIRALTLSHATRSKRHATS